MIFLLVEIFAASSIGLWLFLQSMFARDKTVHLMDIAIFAFLAAHMFVAAHSLMILIF